MILDVLRFSVGTLTAIPVRPPSSMTRRVTVTGFALAPLAVLPLGVLVAVTLLAGRELGLEPILDLGMRLGEGSGALLALPVLRSSALLLRDVALLTEVLP